MNFRTGFYAGIFAAMIWAAWLIRLWQPERQIELHSVHLLEQIEKKNWKNLAERVSPAYQDRWGHDRARLLERLRQVSRILVNPRIEATQRKVHRDSDHNYWSAKITLQASGEFADYVQARINNLDAPFELEWKRGATWPWDWKLIAVRNPELEVPE
ncbi:MAG TPA: hypothetical protein VM940_17360 [Chthoniobacterales bacterium]|jgi:hypothetical protein|nr:hypothetical protein [Chthoniobacterales bacterium]